MAKRKVPLGPAIQWSADFLDPNTPLEITELDIEQARQVWRRDAPKRYKTLLDATEETRQEPGQ